MLARDPKLSAELLVNRDSQFARQQERDLFIEGTKVILINYEEYHLYISGLVRRADIAEDNTVLSSRIADAEKLYKEAAKIAPADAMERLDVEHAKAELE